MNIQQELISLCIKGDRKSEYELYRLCYSYLMSICIRYTRNQDKAKEVLNIGFFKILKHLNKYDPSVPFKPWIRTVIINTLINEFKKEKTHYENIQYVETYYETAQLSEINQAITRSNADQIYSFIADLPPATQQVFNLYYIDGYMHKEIAEMLSITEGTSKWHLNSAREKLKAKLKENNIVIKAS